MSSWNEESKSAADKLEEFILKIRWEDFPQEVQNRAIPCVVDLFTTMIACSQTEMAKCGIKLAQNAFPSGEILIIGSEKKFNTVGAVAAYV